LVNPPIKPRAHDGLAHAHEALRHRDQARDHWEDALTTLTGLGIDHTEDSEATVAKIRRHLAELDQQPMIRPRT